MILCHVSNPSVPAIKWAMQLNPPRRATMGASSRGRRARLAWRLEKLLTEPDAHLLPLAKMKISGTRTCAVWVGNLHNVCSRIHCESGQPASNHYPLSVVFPESLYYLRSAVVLICAFLPCTVILQRLVRDFSLCSSGSGN